MKQPLMECVTLYEAERAALLARQAKVEEIAAAVPPDALTGAFEEAPAP